VWQVQRSVGIFHVVGLEVHHDCCAEVWCVNGFRDFDTIVRKESEAGQDMMVNQFKRMRQIKNFSEVRFF
jgi:hypothetical protein